MASQKKSSEDYPETLPDGLQPFSATPFRFNPTQSSETLKDIEQEITSLENRIKRLANREELNIQGIPVLQQIVALTQDQDQLRYLGKALVRVAGLMPQLEELKKQKMVLEVAKDNPHWLMATFGDFEDEFDIDVLADVDEEL